MATLAITMSKTNRGEDTAKRINAAQLKVPETKTAFQVENKTRFQALQEESVQHNFGNFHRTVREAGEKNPGIQWKEETRMDTARNMAQG